MTACIMKWKVQDVDAGQRKFGVKLQKNIEAK